MVERRNPLALPDKTFDTRLPGLRVVELELTAGAAPFGRRITEVAWPASTLLLAIRRDGQAFSPEHTTTLEQGDRLTLLVPAEQADTLVDQISRNSGDSSATANPVGDQDGA